MSDREKKLLAVMLIALFIIANFFAYTAVLAPKLAADQAREMKAKSKLRQAEQVMAQKAEWEQTIDWLARAEGEPTTYQDANAQLQSYMQNAAQRQGLETPSRGQEILDPIQGSNYDRVRIKQKVIGPEQKVQRWLLDIHRPKQLQVITKFDIQPQKTNTTVAECEVVVEKWFIREDDA